MRAAQAILTTRLTTFTFPSASSATTIIKREALSFVLTNNIQPHETKRNDTHTHMPQQTVFIAGATGYLGRFLVQEYVDRHWNVRALVRQKQDDFPSTVQQVVAQATDPRTFGPDIMDQVDLVVSSLGITRQRDGLTYRDVDFQANLNLLHAALQAKVKQFAYIHVINGKLMSDLGVTAIRAKQDFVQALQDADIQSTIVCPSGFFSDMKDFLDMAKSGRAYLFKDGSHKINPIHGKDLAKASADAIESGRDRVDIGGPDTFTHRQLAELAFECLGREPKITFLPDGIRRFLIFLLPWVTPVHISGPAQFFLTAFGFDMIGESSGTLHLKDFFMETIRREQEEAAKSKQ